MLTSRNLYQNEKLQVLAKIVISTYVGTNILKKDASAGSLLSEGVDIMIFEKDLTVRGVMPLRRIKILSNN